MSMSGDGDSGEPSGHHETTDYLTVREVEQFFRIGRSKAYELCRQPGFPAIKIGRTIRIHRGELEEWVKKELRSRGPTH